MIYTNKKGVKRSNYYSNSALINQTITLYNCPKAIDNRHIFVILLVFLLAPNVGAINARI